MATILLMFDCEGPALEDIPVPLLRPRPGAVTGIPIEETEAPPGAEGCVA